MFKLFWLVSTYFKAYGDKNVLLLSILGLPTSGQYKGILILYKTATGPQIANFTGTGGIKGLAKKNNH